MLKTVLVFQEGDGFGTQFQHKTNSLVGASFCPYLRFGSVWPHGLVWFGLVWFVLWFDLVRFSQVKSSFG